MQKKGKKHHVTLRVVVDNSGGTRRLRIADKGAHLLGRLGPEPPAVPNSRDKLSIIHRKPSEGRFGHAGVIEEGVDLGKKLFVRAHANHDGGLYPISQRVSSHSHCAATMGNVPPMRTEIFRARLRELVDQEFGGDMKAASRAAGLGNTYVRDLLKRDRKTSPNPRLEPLEALAAALKCSVAYLIGEASDPRPNALDTRFADDAQEYLDTLGRLDAEARSMAIAAVKAIAEERQRRHHDGDRRETAT